MSAEVRTVKVEGHGDATYDSDMPMGALRGLLGSASGGSLDGLIVSLSQIVKSWPFEGDPADAEDWDAVKRTEFNALVTAVVEDLGSLGEA